MIPPRSVAFKCISIVRRSEWHKPMTRASNCLRIYSWRRVPIVIHSRPERIGIGISLIKFGTHMTSFCFRRDVACAFSKPKWRITPRQAARIGHPYAWYSMSWELSCAVCTLGIKRLAEGDPKMKDLVDHNVARRFINITFHGAAGLSFLCLRGFIV